ncbi:MAG TPA: DUF2914 domain-containing protein, partial [Candidatus Binatia bacterium]|nr:DUF2914 domain-containing protein [Candidatus Binatia bacterium]
RWMLNGKEVDRVPLDIAGGREQGYRAWSFKRGFPEDPRGEWEVQAITDGGQLIGSVRFEVIGMDAEPALSPAAALPAAPGAPAAAGAAEAPAMPSVTEPAATPAELSPATPESTADPATDAPPVEEPPEKPAAGAAAPD